MKFSHNPSKYSKYVSFIFAFLLPVCFAQQKPDTLKYKSNPNYSLQLELYDVYKPRQADIIMFGNSLTHGGVWNELLGRQNVVEMGVTSDVLRGYLARLNYVFRYRPKIVFIMGGLNDIYNWTPVEEIFASYIKIIKELKSRNIIPVIQLTTYSARNYAKDWGGTPETNAGRNREVDKLNKLLTDYAKSNKIDVIDLLPSITRAGYLKDELTWDGLHFRAEAYRIWAREVEKVLQKNKL